MQGAGWRKPRVPSELRFIWEECWPGRRQVWGPIPALLKTAGMTLGPTLPCPRLSLLSVTRGVWSGDDFQSPLPLIP